MHTFQIDVLVVALDVVDEGNFDVVEETEVDVVTGMVVEEEDEELVVVAGTVVEEEDELDVVEETVVLEELTGGEASQAFTTLVSRVTAVPAYKPPWTEAPVVRLIAAEAKMLPAKAVFVPRVAEVPVIQ